MVLVLRRTYLTAAVALSVALAAGYFSVWNRVTDQTVAALSWVLANRVIVVDPGHGGVDPGAIGPGGTVEKEVTLAVGLKLKQMLSQAGAVVVMVRETDTDLSTPGQGLGSRKREDLNRRIAMARDHGGEVYLGLQANAFGTRWTGAQTFYYPSSEESRRLAEAVQGEFIRVLGNTTRRARPLDVYVLRNLNSIPATIIEMGFLSNAQEEKLLADPFYQQKLAFAIYSGVVHYLAGGGVKAGFPGGSANK